MSYSYLGGCQVPKASGLKHPLVISESSSLPNSLQNGEAAQLHISQGPTQATLPSSPQPRGSGLTLPSPTLPLQTSVGPCWRHGALETCHAFLLQSRAQPFILGSGDPNTTLLERGVMLGSLGVRGDTRLCPPRPLPRISGPAHRRLTWEDELLLVFVVVGC